MAAASSAAASAAVAAPKHFDILQLPSVKHGMSLQEESTKRRKTCRFIEEAGRVLKLPRVAIATSMVFLHRFYAKHSFQDHDRFEVAVACIVLAAKTEESPKKLNNVIDECYKLKVRGMQAGRISATAAGGPAVIPPSSLDPKGEEFHKLKERILLLERVILHTIGFELSINHPYTFLVEQIKRLVHVKRDVEYAKPPSGLPTAQIMAKMFQEIAQYAMNFANDSMHTSLCLQFEPDKIATATVYLACQFAKVRPVGNNKTWLQVLGHPDVETLASICLQIIELIAERKGSDVARLELIRRELDQLKDDDGDRDGTSALASTKPAAPPDSKRPRLG